MPSGLGPYFDCSDLGVSISIDRARRDEKDLVNRMEVERREVFRKLRAGRLSEITADQRRIYGIDDKGNYQGL